MTEHDTETSEQPSKSQRKRDAEAQQKLGERLVQLDETRLADFALPEALHEAILAARSIKQHGAKKRQLQYIGKLMRQIDTDPIEAGLVRLDQQRRQQATAFHQVEQWRDRLLQDEAALPELIAQYPAVDRQHLRQLLRNARNEQHQNKSPRAARNLFRYLRELLDADRNQD